jgi:hypothetical protein
VVLLWRYSDRPLANGGVTMKAVMRGSYDDSEQRKMVSVVTVYLAVRRHVVYVDVL